MAMGGREKEKGWDGGWRRDGRERDHSFTAHRSLLEAMFLI